MSERRTHASAAVYATPVPWQDHYAPASQPGEVYPPGHHHQQYPSTSYVTHSSSTSLRNGQASPSSYQTVMGQTGGYQSPDRQSSPYNPVQQHDRPSPHSGLPVHQHPPQLQHHHQQLSSSYQHTSRHSLSSSPKTVLSQHPYSHPRSLQAHASLSYPSPPPPLPAQLAAASPHYHQQYVAAPLAYTQSMDAASQYPASPQRPFSCDMCALSFNRQHDLKRHRDTHTGEKPFLCNGGCGKTFTRKDALKRHQLVKRCGIDDGA
ncbi:hypothetical protein BC835DRAFT_1518552 [Cytidiella melzeri]|nr:hypothetical protein BC835DRAFT_1518552 [Cytidiella melzeri]